MDIRLEAEIEVCGLDAELMVARALDEAGPVLGAQKRNGVWCTRQGDTWVALRINLLGPLTPDTSVTAAGHEQITSWRARFLVRSWS